MSRETSASASRRDLFKLLGAGAVAATVPGVAYARQAERGLRVAHLTDLHHQARGDSEAGILACLEHLSRPENKPDLILIGGDLMTGTMSRTLNDVRPFYDRVADLLRSQTIAPIEYCIGNHDIWGWNKADSKATGDEPEYGKAWWKSQFRQERTYKSFDRGGWHFVILDSVHPFETQYEGNLDPEQMQWLQSDLATVPQGRPVLVLTHIPVLSGGMVMTDGRRPAEPQREAGITIPRPSQLVNAFEVIDLFRRRGNVRLVLSGHVHIEDRVDYLGTTHICGGAVSGTWWRSQEADARRRAERNPDGPPRPPRSLAGYGLIDLSPQGTFTYRYQTFGWVARDEG